MAKTTTSAKTYTADDIKKLPYPDCVRKRPGMYIGPTDANGKITSIREILNNSVDEHLAGHCSVINVIRWSDDIFSIEDNGRGVPHTDPKNPKKNVMKDIFGELHSGRNFEAKTVYSTGLNGVGSSVVNALSSSFSVRSRRDGEDHTILFNEGKYVKVDKLTTKVGKGQHKTGTLVKFELDSTLFEGTLDVKVIKNLLKETAYLNAGLQITFRDDTTGDNDNYQFSNGIEEYLESKFSKTNAPLIAPINISKTINDCKIEIAFTYGNNFSDESVTSFVNTINTGDGGTHVTGFKRSLSLIFNKSIKEAGIIKEQLDPEDFKEGLTAIVSVFVFEPKFTSQTKS